MSIRTDFIQFGNAASIERYLERRCGYPLQYLKEKGVLSLIANDFADRSISTAYGDMPFNNRLILVLTDSGLEDTIARSVMPVLTMYLKEYKQDG